MLRLPQQIKGWAMLFMLLIPYHLLLAQSSTTFDLTSPAAIYEPSKKATEMVRVADIPVSYYTGKPDISFPLYEIKSGTLLHKISLNYSGAGGILVESQGSWAGTGFDVTVGGAIVRTPVGRPDELTTMGYNDAAASTALPLWNTANPTSWLNTLTTCDKKNIGDGRLDLLPDMYYVNFDGQSAKIFFDRTGAVFFTPYKPWKLTGSVSTGFVITIENGTRYEFSNIESSTYDIETLPGDDGSNFTCKTAWFLSRIISPNRKDTIKFNYTATSFNNFDDLPSETKYTAVPDQPTGCLNQQPPSDNATKTYNHQTTNSFTLTSVVYKSGKVEFNSVNDRADINTGDKARLKEISFYNATGQTYTLIKKIKLNHFYANAAATDVLKKRLFLVNFVDVAGTDSLQTSFSYINPDGLPARNSYSQDHWGFYNGASNNSLIPALTDGFVDYAGANRELDSAAMQCGLLNTITHPTGGVTTFEYEPNQYSFFKNASIYRAQHYDSSAVTAMATATTMSGSLPSVYQDTTMVYVPNVPGVLSVTYFLTGIIPTDPQATVEIYDAAFHLIWASGNSNGTTRTQNISLNKGATYYLVAERVGFNEKCFLTLNYKNWNYFTAPALYSKLAGGNRLKRITTFDGFNHANDQVVRFKYQLNDSITSGYLLDEAKYAGYSYVPYYCTGTPAAKGGDWMMFNRYGNSLVALGRTQGSPIGYSRVVAQYGENAENGYEEFTYTLPGFMDAGGSGYPYIPRTSYDELRGMPLAKRVYDGNGRLLKSTINEWNYNNTAGQPNLRCVWGAKCGVQRVSNTFVNGCPTGPDWSFNIGMYQRFQFWPTLKSSTDSLYDVTNGTGLGIKTSYTYDSVSAQVTRKDVTGSDNIIETTTYSYPADFTGTAVYDSMVARNMVSEVIEQRITKGGVQIYREKNNFSFFSGMIAPSSKEMIRADQPLENRLTFSAYDYWGNLTEQSKSNDLREVYLWGYGGEYPVAKIIGASYSSVSGLVIPANLDAPADDQAIRTEIAKVRSALAGKSAQVFTITYSPYGKITSETNAAGVTTYYTFDGLGRQTSVRDHNGMIIKLFEHKIAASINQ
ncbi:RHS repeat protein [Chitinophaga filiformis]|uniref:YD repeat-containing protein n=1 Tax=Chitinophaga filiformis TaxID=104663 RepID=A0A1G7MHA6_CHIFI|nr:RHS repeat protein [Chitinophaga filiformis]SDF61212.1 YD repeat-containing protein [Chitinophaga filiformis]